MATDVVDLHECRGAVMRAQSLVPKLVSRIEVIGEKRRTLSLGGDGQTQSAPEAHEYGGNDSFVQWLNPTHNANHFGDSALGRSIPDSRHVGATGTLGLREANEFVGQTEDPDCRRRALGGARHGVGRTDLGP
jgi:hypothetical protein